MCARAKKGLIKSRPRQTTQATAMTHLKTMNVIKQQKRHRADTEMPTIMEMDRIGLLRHETSL